MSTEIKRLREERAGLAAKANELLTKAAEEKRNLTPEEDQMFDTIHTDVDQLKSQIDRHERQADLDADLSERVGREDSDRKESPEAVSDAETRGLAMQGWLATGSNVTVTDEQREAAKRCGINFANREMDFSLARTAPKRLVEGRAQSVGTTTAGGHAVPTGFVSEVETAMLRFGGIREAATVIRTATGQDLPFITVDDTSNAGVLLGENTQVAEQDVTFGQVILGAFKYSSKLVRVSVELMQDEAINLEQYLGRLLGERIARVVNTDTTTGDGSAKPHGLQYASTVGKTAAAVNAVTYAELIDLKHSVDPAYRTDARWMFSDATLAAIKKITDDQSRPLWQAGIAVGEPDRIDGDRYIINQDVPDMATTAKAIVYGDFSKFVLRDVLGISLIRLNERYADYHQVAFLAISRHDSDLLDAGTNPVKSIQMA